MQVSKPPIFKSEQIELIFFFSDWLVKLQIVILQFFLITEY